MNSWFYIDSAKRDAAFNMAMDEALLEHAAELGQSILRFYGWAEPAASFGYFQKYSEVEQAILLRPLIRRPTGGGIVPHDADWTYSFTVPPGHEWHSLKAEESYRRIHEWIRDAFARLKITTELAPCCKKLTRPGSGRGDEAQIKNPGNDQRLLTASPTGQCFIGHEKFDLLWQEKKIAGAAQRRNKAGLLIQGSVQPPPIKIAHADWKTAMLEAAREQWQVNWKDLSPDKILVAQVERLVREKYSQAVYNQKR